MRSLTFARLGCALALGLSGAAAAAGAQTAPAAPTRLGLLAGVNFARVAGNDTEDDVGTRTGFVGGAYLTLGLTPTVSFRPELLYSMKGAKATGVDAGEVKLDYLLLPVLLQVDVPTTSAVRPHFYAGPTLGYRVGCTLTAEGATIDCDELDEFEDAAAFKRFDLGVMLGGGLGFAVGGRTATIGARYDFGLSKIATDADVMNRVLSVYASVEFPMR